MTKFLGKNYQGSNIPKYADGTMPKYAGGVLGSIVEKVAKAVKDAIVKSTGGGRDRNDGISNSAHYTKNNDSFGIGTQNNLKQQGYSTQQANGNGFGYADQYGFTHVSKDYHTAMGYSKDGKVYDYEGAYSGGYGRNDKGGRVNLAGINGSTPFGNSKKDDLSPDS